MLDYIELAWATNEPYLILEYDSKLERSIGLDNLINRINKGVGKPVFERGDYPNVLKLNLTEGKLIYKSLTDLIELWNTQSIMYDYDKDPYLSIYGLYQPTNYKEVLSRKYIYCFGHRVEVGGLDLRKTVSFAKAYTASGEISMLSLEVDSMFDFNKFLSTRSGGGIN